MIDVEFKYETDPDKKYQDVVRELDAIRRGFAAGDFDIEVLKFSPSDVNIIQVGIDE